VQEGFYAATLSPGRGRAELSRTTRDQSGPLVERADLGGLLGNDDWKHVSIRAQGPKLWLLVNDQVVLSTVDSTHDIGDLSLGISRFGGLDDQEEVSVVLRNFRVARLAGSDAGRDPVFMAPPALGETVLEQPLTGSGVFQSGVCPTGRNETDFTADGFLMRVTGKCREANPFAGISAPLQGVKLPDGDVHAQVRFGAASERAIYRTYFREGPELSGGYWVDLTTRGAFLYRGARGRAPVFLGGRDDLARLIAPGAWVSVAVRVQGADLWVLVNDEPVVYAWDPTYSEGEVWIEFDRTGDAADQQETSITIRNLRISRVAPPS
jgi:hypothetical protein